MIEEDLKNYSKIVNKQIEKIMPRKSEPSKELYSILWEFFDRGGKRLRPAIAMISYLAVSNKKINEEILNAAAAIEMIHQGTLLHDDIEDDSLERRGKPCIHRIHGVPIAINCGDVLYFKAFVPISKLKNEKARLIISESVLKVGEGQAYDIYWAQNNIWGLKEKDYIKMVERKTGVLIGATCAVGAYLGGANEKVANTLYNFGKSIGVAFQIQDDVLNVIGDEKKYGKEIGGDITEGKRTLMVIHAINNANEKDRKRLIEILSKHTRDPNEINEAIQILKATGSIDYAINYAKKIVEKEKKNLQRVRFKNKEAAKILLDLADFFIKREF
jgi:geranylgeranyl diphosphate synthase type I